MKEVFGIRVSKETAVMFDLVATKNEEIKKLREKLSRRERLVDALRLYINYHCDERWRLVDEALTAIMNEESKEVVK